MVSDYDEVPYPSAPIRQTHPCCMATLAYLFNLTPPNPRQSRVLELGCASGGNLFPMAQDLPESSFLGVDLSSRQIDDGLGQLRRIQLDNVEIRTEDIANITEEFGKFDYIICHGVFSWAPRKIQDKILEIGRKHLTENGLLYVSYNTYPGWHFRGIVRDMMRYHVAPIADPQEKIIQARTLLEFLVNSADSEFQTYQTVLAEEAKTLSQHSDAYLFHEHLEEVNEPLYFSEFVERTESAGLQYLGEAEFPMMLHENFDPATARILAEAPMLRQEQYMDFLRARTFRCSLLCHSELNPNRKVGPERLSGLNIALAEPIELTGVDLDSPDAVERDLMGGVITVSLPVTKHALNILSNFYPGTIRLEELEERVRSAVKGKAAGNLERLRSDMLAMLSKGAIRALVDPPEFTRQPGDYPLATPLARDQAKQGQAVTNRLHTSFQLDPVAQWLLPKLDGKSSGKQLAVAFQSAVREGRFEVTDGDNVVTDLDIESCQRVVNQTISRLTSDAFFIG